MKPLVVVDTNVALVANDSSPQAGPDCVIACVKRLEEVQSGERVALDEQGRILGEYFKKGQRSGGPGVGDEFVKWVWDHQADCGFCATFAITPHVVRGFVEFPEDEDLSSFDHDDRVFVAVAVASGKKARILNAVDSGWWSHRDVLGRNGIRVDFLCPELMGA